MRNVHVAEQVNVLDCRVNVLDLTVQFAESILYGKVRCNGENCCLCKRRAIN